MSTIIFKTVKLIIMFHSVNSMPQLKTVFLYKVVQI